MIEIVLKAIEAQDTEKLSTYIFSLLAENRNLYQIIEEQKQIQEKLTKSVRRVADLEVE